MKTGKAGLYNSVYIGKILNWFTFSFVSLLEGNRKYGNLETSAEIGRYPTLIQVAINIILILIHLHNK